MSFIKTILKIAAGLILAFILLCIVITVIAPDAQTTNNTTTSSKNAQMVASVPAPAIPVIGTDICDFDWTFQTTPYIGDYYIAPTGSSYVLVNLYLKNNGNKPISTNPYYWNFVANGIKYTVDVATFDSSIHSQTVEVGKGGEIETQLVYLVNGVPTEATLEFNGFSGPDLLKVQHYTLETLLGPP